MKEKELTENQMMAQLSYLKKSHPYNIDILDFAIRCVEEHFERKDGTHDIK